MKTKTLLTLFAVTCAASIIAQTSSYTALEAAKHDGETATVTFGPDGALYVSNVGFGPPPMVWDRF